MFGVLGAIVCLAVGLCTSSVGAGRWTPVDCAFSVWSDWTLHQSEQFESRTRHVIREAFNGGRPCTGDLTEYRAAGAQPPAGHEDFVRNLLAGNAPSYSLGGGKRYTLSRDIAVVLDTTVGAVIFPYYKSFISNIVGAICGDIGSRGQDHRLNVASFDRSAVEIVSFNAEQSREVIQDKILEIERSYHSQSYLTAGTDHARTVLSSDNSGTRRYNNATKTVLFVTSERSYCSRAFTRSADRLKTTAEVYVIVLGPSTSQSSCLEPLASLPTSSHFLRLENISEIAELSRVLITHFPVNNFCFSPAPSSENY